MDGIPDFRREREPGHASWFQRWRCRRRGGHFDGRAYVLLGKIAAWSRVCSSCGTYLGSAPSPDPFLTEAVKEGGE
jgi:hypothetical protein